MGVYPEDCVIDVPNLMRLWVSEGFLKTSSNKCMKIVAKEYFNDLVGRNLILVNETEYSGETVRCKVHDLLVDVCVREAEKHKFLCVARHSNFSNPQDLNTQRRIVVHDGTMREAVNAFLSYGTLVRSMTCKYPDSFPKSFNSKLLRVWNGSDIDIGSPFLENAHGILNCRYISSLYIHSNNFTLPLPSSNFSLWNLQILYVSNPSYVVATSEIWKMSQLKHAYFYKLNLLDPPSGGQTNDEGDDFVLGNLQSLIRVRNFKFSEDMVKKIPDIKEFGVCYEGIEDWSSCCLNNLVQLINLESLSFEISFLKERVPSELLENPTFPRSLMELTLGGIKRDWGDMRTKIGSLPHLQMLKLSDNLFIGPEWETVEGQFRSLKYLEIEFHHDLIHLKANSANSVVSNTWRLNFIMI